MTTINPFANALESNYYANYEGECCIEDGNPFTKPCLGKVENRVTQTAIVPMCLFHYEAI